MEILDTDQNTDQNTDHPAGWRHEAMNETLRGFGYAEYLEALVREVRRAMPTAATLVLWPDRPQLLRFLEGKATGLRSLLPDSAEYYSEARGRAHLRLGWLAVEWQGETVEVVLTPSSSESENVICIGRSADVLRRFGQELIAYTNRPAGRCLRYSQGWENAPDMDAEIGKVTWDDIVLPAVTLVRIREAVEGFYHHREAFTALGFAWKRGVLLIGPPGTGKTMVCKAAAAALPDLPFLYVRDLDRDCNRREVMRTIFERARALSPCILALEDMDGFVNDQNRTVFLNELDGFGSNNGLLIIASSNHPGKIDEALLKRPSRFDRVFHIGLLGLEERAEYGRRLLARSALAPRLSPALDVETLAQDVAVRTEGFTPAYLKEAFLSAALQQAQEGVTLLDAPFAAAVLLQVDELKAHLRRMDDPEALAEMSATSGTLGFRH